MLFSINKFNEKCLFTQIKGRNMFFPFTTVPLTKSINILQKIVKNKENFVDSLKEEINFKTIKKITCNKVEERIEEILDKINKEICAEVPNVFWNRKRHELNLPYMDEFNKEKIPTKARPIAMGKRLLKYCKEEIDSLLKKGLIRKNNSPWSCPVFYVENAVEIERGASRLVINYKPLNKALKWIKHTLPNKSAGFFKATIFYSFDLKSGFYQKVVIYKTSQI